MCGIVAAAAEGSIVQVLIEGLKKLEYRGYDSAGAAFLAPRLERIRANGRVVELERAVQGRQSRTGIAHTRWATHGRPSEHNAHPHVSASVAVVHNGIIENFEELRLDLQTRGYTFTSDTDSEVIAHLVFDALKTTPELLGAVAKATRQLRGAFAIAVIDERFPDTVVVAREGSPLLLGLGEGAFQGHYAASDASALLQVTRRMVYLENGDLAELTPGHYRIARFREGMLETLSPAARPVALSQLSADAVELGRFRHYMQKEIFEQPDAVANTLEMAAAGRSLDPRFFGSDAASIFPQIDSILILACGTSAHAGLTARYWLEAIAGLPCTVEIASEYRYRQSIPHPNALVIGISQSGETADTLAALRHAHELGHAHRLALCNVPESAIVRECPLRFITRAGPEIGVASTKAFTTQLSALFLLSLVLAKVRGRLTLADESHHLETLRHLPAAIEGLMALEPAIQAWAKRFATREHALFLGRGIHYPIAMEGALKLKEISYIHAEAYPAGELKHGPLALIDENMPVIAVAPNDALIDKLKGNLQEVRARGGELFIFADQDSQIDDGEHIHVIKLPENRGELSPILHVVPLQLLAYHVALVKGTDVDKPRNLAKSVTVE